MPEIIYIRVRVSLDIEGMPGWERVEFPIKTAIYNNFFPSVTLTETIQNDLRKRLKGVKNMLITLREESESVLQADFQTTSDLFADYIFCAFLKINAKPLESLEKIEV